MSMMRVYILSGYDNAAGKTIRWVASLNIAQATS